MLPSAMRNSSTTSTVADRPVAFAVQAVGPVVRPAVRQRRRLVDPEVGVQQGAGAVAIAGAEPSPELGDDAGGRPGGLGG